MMWDKDELKKAHSGRFLGLEEVARNDIVQRFDSVYNRLSLNQKEVTNPVSFLGILVDETTRQAITTPAAAAVTSTFGAPGGTQDGCWRKCRQNCTIL